MLETMVFEAKLEALRKKEPLRNYSAQEIADFCGCSRNTIQRIETSALEKIKSVLPQ
jgi:DNA-directed RNA polymerase specialized sigma24 family protein